MNKQRGFSVVEIVLVILVIGLIGALGWLVYDRQHERTSININTSKANNSINNNDAQTNGSNNSQAETKYLVIKEWGIKIPLGDSVQLTYVLEKNNTARIRSSALEKVSENGCKSNSISVVRGLADDMLPNELDSSNGPTFAKVYSDTTVNNSDITPRSIKLKVSDYYYLAPGYSGASCVYSGSKTDLLAEKQAEINIVKSFNQGVLSQ